MGFRHAVIIVLLFVGNLNFSNRVRAQITEHPNILLIMVDDMRQHLEVLGDEIVRSPNISRLSNESITFPNSFCQYPVCTPSRTSMLTGLRPDESGIYLINQNLEELKGPDTLLTIPTFFSQNGYTSYGFGKVFHHWNASYFDVTERVRPNPFNAPRDYYTDENKKLHEEFGIGPAFESADVHDTTYVDGWTTGRAIEALNEHDEGTPFFMAVGFFKPHLPFNVPKKYWDYYDPEQLPATSIKEYPENASEFFGFNSAELRAYHGVPGSSAIKPELGQQLTHGYYAAISYIDEQVGKILKELEDLKLRENTIIILWSDHGYKLGDYSEWAKHTLTNLDTKTVLMVSHPEFRSRRINYEIVEAVDLFPMMCSFSNLPVPNYLSGNDISSRVTNVGSSLVNLSSPYPQAMSQVLRSSEQTMGYSLKSNHYNYNVWIDTTSNEVVDREYYHVVNDSLETKNIYSQLPVRYRASLDSIANSIIIDKNYASLSAFSSWSNNSPSFEVNKNLLIQEGIGFQKVENWAHNISDGDDHLQEVSFIVDNDKDDIFSEPPSISNGGALRFKARPDAFGEVTVSVVLMDNGGIDNGGIDRSEQSDFIITIESVNDAPVISNIENQEITEQGYVTFYIDDVDNKSDELEVCAFSGNQVLIPDDRMEISSNGNEYNLRIEPVMKENGETTITINVTDGIDEKSTSFLVSVNSVVLDIDERNSRIDLYPNPANNTVFIDIPTDLLQKDCGISVFDINGRIKYHSTFCNSGQMFLDISNYPKGIYFVSIKSGEEVWSKKVLIK